ncbi:phosphoglycerate dehydrogenase [Candidatus Endoriftia persephone]|jgi:D-3-phosphoglycerate dehydrogenase|uniref:D-3-phosphoglycerate dehydrogenase n=3 Tax=Gammaproteobacteria TaxID=1236 RepID=G2FHX9_9GAMM|nr:phosphoglycerate dehydrogenase [Candidatus Endoriftia persephone]EGV52467.1 D-3-phosphoglycerate dehydrogenase [endosymbiont of Riftia pachyptila (vent Ph05)]EGW53571.1 D-3-phosphoglycerate dehydrogenase [endosymbiont of Tevnia jerichonana (vent Tica)]USF86981.1 phosphoglycerate dehydrogenase [Candidatus Endoriftia persephone]
MRENTPIAVTSRSFSRHPVLRAELLERYSDVKFNDDGVSLAGEDLIEYCRGRRKIISALETIDEPFLKALPELEIISKYGVGTDMLDKEALIRHGIKLGWTGGVNRRSVTELVISCAISLLRHVPAGSREAREGVWKNRMGKEISGRTVGIIGCGYIGKDLTPILNAFGCKVLAHDILDFPEFYAQHNVEAVSLEELLQRSDIVTLHLPLDDSTRNILNAERLALMKPDAMLINAARGGLVDDAALKKILQEGKIAAAALDVFAVEPPDDLEMLQLPNLLVTPHIGGSSEEAILAMGRAAIAGLDENKIPTADYPPAG